jgi:hypothetical protein
MATSSADEAPRGLEFLYDRHRLNVATSRARAIAIIVASPDLIWVSCRTPHQTTLMNALCRGSKAANPRRRTGQIRPWRRGGRGRLRRGRLGARRVRWGRRRRTRRPGRSCWGTRRWERGDVVAGHVRDLLEVLQAVGAFALCAILSRGALASSRAFSVEMCPGLAPRFVRIESARAGTRALAGDAVIQAATVAPALLVGLARRRSLEPRDRGRRRRQAASPHAAGRRRRSCSRPGPVV